MSGNEVVNDIEVCLVSLRRSGHHAILNWIAEQLPGPAFHLNNLTIGENPFTTARNRLERSGRLGEVGPFAAEERGSLTPKKLLLVNYEDCDLRRVGSEEERSHREAALGRSRKRVTVLVLRDHYNLFASRIKRVRLGSTDPRENLTNALRARRLYAQYAREYLGETRTLGEGTIAISFNRWFADEAYRRDLSARLGGTYSEATLNDLATHGAGSSFDGTRYRDRAREMDVLGRWRELQQSALFHAVVNERGLRSLTERIFGPMGYPHGRILMDVAGRIVRPACVVLDRFARRMARHGSHP